MGLDGRRRTPSRVSPRVPGRRPGLAGVATSERVLTLTADDREPDGRRRGGVVASHGARPGRTTGRGRDRAGPTGSGPTKPR